MSDEEFQFYFPSSPPAPPPTPGGGAATTASSTRRSSGGFGAGPFGAMAFGSGGGVSIADVVQETRNSLLVTFSGPVQIFNAGAVTDVLYDRGYELEVYNVPLGYTAAAPPMVVHCERVTSMEARLYTDAELDGPDVVYRLIGSSDVFGNVPVSSRSALFRSFGQDRIPRQVQTRPSRGGDLANPPQGSRDPGTPISLGTFSIEGDGDYRNDAGLVNTKKRILRRLTTAQGTFRHLPTYGLRLSEKTLATPIRLRDLQAQALEQLLEEPDVQTAEVQVSLPYPGEPIALLSVDVTTRSGATFGVDVKVPLEQQE